MAAATNERMEGKSNTLAMLAAGVAELDPISAPHDTQAWPSPELCRTAAAVQYFGGECDSSLSKAAIAKAAKHFGVASVARPGCSPRRHAETRRVASSRHSDAALLDHRHRASD